MVYSNLVDLRWYQFHRWNWKAMNPRWIHGWYQFHRLNCLSRVSSWDTLVECSDTLIVVDRSFSWRHVYSGFFATGCIVDVVRSYVFSSLLKMNCSCWMWWSGRVMMREWCSARLYAWYCDWFGSGGGMRCQWQRTSWRSISTKVRSWESLAKIMFGVYCSVKYRNWA